MRAALATAELLGVRFAVYDKQGLLQALADRIDRGQKSIVLSGNVHGFNLAYEQPWLRRLFNQADFIRLDGNGLRLGARMLGQTLPPRLTWADFVWDLAALAEPRGDRFFLLGARPGVAEAAADRLRARHARLQVVGMQHGFFTPQPGHPENEAVLAQIAAVRPDILLVGMGMPRQERWIHNHRERLPATITMTVGALFDYVSGRLRRPPRLFTATGLEWAGRLLIEPRRLGRRYLIGNPLFLWRVVRQRAGYRPVPHIE